MRKKYNNDAPGIAINEIPLFICWKDDDYKALANMIAEIRSVCGYTASDEYIYSICKSILHLSEADEKRYKISNICHEMPDEFIRKMRMTGLISIRGGGRFIDINNQEIEKVKYIIDHYSEIKSFESERDYYEYAKGIDTTLVSLSKTMTATEEENRSLFMKWVDTFDLETLKNELIIVSDNHQMSHNNIFKYINEPLRLEFLTALALQKKFASIIVKPNYVADDEGMPTSYAPGGSPDIQCLDEKGNVLFEVTLMRGRQQVSNEMIPIERHLSETKVSDANAFSVFLAPNIHPDTVRYAQFAKFNNNIDIVPLEIAEFANSLSTVSKVRDYL